MRDEVTRQSPQTTTFKENGEPKRIRTEVPLYQPNALPLGQTASQPHPHSRNGDESSEANSVWLTWRDSNKNKQTTTYICINGHTRNPLTLSNAFVSVLAYTVWSPEYRAGECHSNIFSSAGFPKLQNLNQSWRRARRFTALRGPTRRE